MVDMKIMHYSAGESSAEATGCDPVSAKHDDAGILHAFAAMGDPGLTRTSVQATH